MGSRKELAARLPGEAPVHSDALRQPHQPQQLGRNMVRVH
eukprot:COSAG06_NODE_64483_length_259_cov_0.956250_1_plen_39_part_10